MIVSFNVRPFVQQHEPLRFFAQPFRKVNVRPEQAEDERAGNPTGNIHARRNFRRVRKPFSKAIELAQLRKKQPRRAENPEIRQKIEREVLPLPGGIGLLRAA